MALPPPSDTLLVREVDEELRLEALLRFWRRWNRWVIAGAVVVALALAGFIWWRAHEDDAAGAQGEKRNAAFQD